MSPARLWLLSISLRRRGHRRLALFVKRINALLYHNSLPINAAVASDIRFEHHAFGVMIHDSVVIGRRVRIWHHVTLTVRGIPGAPAKLIVEDDVKIGAHAIVIAPIGKTMRIGRAARIGAGTIVTQNVPDGATVVSPPPRVLMHRSEKRLDRLDRELPTSAAEMQSEEFVRGERLPMGDELFEGPAMSAAPHGGESLERAEGLGEGRAGS
jgi:serine O-acetyltransferase